MNYKNSNEKYLKLLKQGNLLAFDVIYKEYHQRLYGFVLKFLKQKEDAEEIVQEVFLKIWESRKKIDVYSSFDSFLFTIAYNTTINLLRKKMSQEKYIGYLKNIQKVDDAVDFIDEVEYNELKEKVDSLINRLSPRQQEIFRLSREAGLTHNEIAKKLNISENTVKNHLVSLLKFIKSNIDSNLIISALFISLFF